MIRDLFINPRGFYRRYDKIYNHSHVVFLIVAAGIITILSIIP